MSRNHRNRTGARSAPVLNNKGTFGIIFSLVFFASLPAQAESAFGKSSENVERIDAPEAGKQSGDGVYGRFNGDLALSIGAGIEADLQTSTVRPLVTGSFSFYQTAGLYASLRESVQESDPIVRAVSAGLDLSPLFLLRWSRALEKGPAFWDLTLDSLRLSAGAAFRQPVAGAFFDEAGAELGLGLGVPLMGRANGLWLRSRGQMTTGPNLGGAVWMWLSWQGFVQAGVLKVDH